MPNTLEIVTTTATPDGAEANGSSKSGNMLHAIGNGLEGFASKAHAAGDRLIARKLAAQEANAKLNVEAGTGQDTPSVDSVDELERLFKESPDESEKTEASVEANETSAESENRGREFFRSIGTNAIGALRRTGEFFAGAGILAGRRAKAAGETVKGKTDEVMTAAKSAAGRIVEEAKSSGDALTVRVDAGFDRLDNGVDKVRQGIADRFTSAMERKKHRLDTRAELKKDIAAAKEKARARNAGFGIAAPDVPEQPAQAEPATSEATRPIITEVPAAKPEESIVDKKRNQDWTEAIEANKAYDLAVAEEIAAAQRAAAEAKADKLAKAAALEAEIAKAYEKAVIYDGKFNEKAARTKAAEARKIARQQKWTDRKAAVTGAALSAKTALNNGVETGIAGISGAALTAENAAKAAVERTKTVAQGVGEKARNAFERMKANIDDIRAVGTAAIEAAREAARSTKQTLSDQKTLER